MNIESEIKLNLARKWRSKTFEEIVGQELSVRMLKNGLYLQQFFPVYLFSGQRGCGKTTTARVFAAALNCERLSEFQKHPQKTVLPCLSCGSCMAMQSGNHPDFIEIDAASHTGVDNVRYIVESASLLPLMGNKKVYLIDEAHMLSKAAFNAFLKILEEPPASALFILATTDPQKIIDTVRSRCFQLFFKPVESKTLYQRLALVCDTEGIGYDQLGLETIIKETEGSVRDALNLLEQVRFASKIVSGEAVLRVLGHMDDATLVTIFECVMLRSPRSLLLLLQQLSYRQFSAQTLWNRFVEIVRAALWVSYGVDPQQFVEHLDQLKAIVKKCSAKQLRSALEVLYEYEQLFSRSTAKHDLFELMLMRICQNNGNSDVDGGASSSAPLAAQGDIVFEGEDEDCDDEHEDEDQDDEDLDDPIEMKWKRFVTNVETIQEPLITSIFSQGVIKGATETHLDVEFPQKFVFFQDRLRETKSQWEPLFKKLFGSLLLNTLFTGPIPEQTVARPVAPRPVITPKPQPVAQSVRQPYPQKSYPKKINKPFKPFGDEKRIDISDEEIWKKAHMILRYIPGTITEISASAPAQEVLNG